MLRGSTDAEFWMTGWLQEVGGRKAYTCRPEEGRERSVRCLYVDKVGEFGGEQWIPPMKAKQT